jgi:hypothetical protein
MTRVTNPSRPFLAPTGFTASRHGQSCSIDLRACQAARCADLTTRFSEATASAPGPNLWENRAAGRPVEVVAGDHPAIATNEQGACARTPGS